MAAELCATAIVMGIAATGVDAAPVVRAARVHAVLTSPIACDVEAAYTIQTDQPARIPFTLQTFDGTQVELSAVNGAAVTAPRSSTRARRPCCPRSWPPDRRQPRFAITSRRRQSGRIAVPIWLPAVPTDGRPGAVSLQVEWPSGATLTGATLPPLQRTADGRVVLARSCSRVRARAVCRSRQSEHAPGWDVTRVMDVATVGVLLVASLVWLVVRERRRRRAPAQSN